jgi:alpha-1,3-glucosyltransferase
MSPELTSLSPRVPALDYPPFFAYFSYILSLPARFLLPHAVSSTILRLSSAPIEDWNTVVYMRTTVLLSETCLAFGLLRFVALLLLMVSPQAA